jgi:seryl-tRNA synthetase
VHQFTKVEMFAYTLPGESDPMLEYLKSLECRLFDGLGIAYRVIDTATGDLGGPAYRKYDLEAWMPGRNEFGEVTSTSNCTDFQARRLDIRGRFPGSAGAAGEVRPLATLNGTLCAMTRTIVAILETHQQADGSVRVPAALQPFLGRELLEPVAGG